MNLVRPPQADVFVVRMVDNRPLRTQLDSGHHGDRTGEHSIWEEEAEGGEGRGRGRPEGDRRQRGNGWEEAEGGEGRGRGGGGGDRRVIEGKGGMDGSGWRK